MAAAAAKGQIISEQICDALNLQRDLVGVDEHSYHQHIYPFQLVGGFEES